MIFHLTALVLAKKSTGGSVGRTISRKTKSSGSSEQQDSCTSSELIATEQFVYNEAENVKNQTETVAKVKTFLCSSNCGRSLLEYESYFVPNQVSRENLLVIREINEIQCNLALMSQNSLAILFVLLI
jgi:hypothetical protein